jgi:hypothetical protein
MVVVRCWIRKFCLKYMARQLFFNSEDWFFEGMTLPTNFINTMQQLVGVVFFSLLNIDYQ